MITSPDAGFNARDGSTYQYRVVGVISDFHFQSLHQRITPLVFANLSKFGNNATYTAVRIESNDFGKTLERVGALWKQFVPKRAFHFEFLDRSLANQYQAEQRLQKLFTIFSGLAIFIACIGLMGLAAYATQLRTREISIRKVLGAGSGNIVGMLSVNFMRLVVFSFLVAFPLAWWAMQVWLRQFAYQATMPLWIFLVAGLLALLIAMATVSFQAIKAALANPVKSLRTE